MNQTTSANTQDKNQSPPDFAGRRVIFFDGVCGLCNHFVNFVLARDVQGQFLFAPLQGTTSQELLGRTADSPVDSVVFWDAGHTYQKSAAVVQILKRLGGIWRILGGLLWLIPRPLRDLGYAGVAKIRYRLFGKKEVCRMPTPEERERFLD